MNQDAWNARLVAERRAADRQSEAAAHRLARQVSHEPSRDEERTARLLVAARAGDQRAWRQLVDLHSPPLAAVAYACGVAAADTPDVVQFAWLKLVENIDRIHDPARLRSWLATTCRREAIRVSRANAGWSTEDAHDPAGTLARRAGDHDPAELAIRNDTRRILHTAVAELPGRQRQLLVELLRGEDAAEAYAAVAERLEMPIGSVGPTRQRALRRLRGDRQLLALRGPLTA